MKCEIPFPPTINNVVDAADAAAPFRCFRLLLQGRTLELAPRIDRQVCLAFDDGEVDLAALPDVRGWAYAGQEALPKGDGSSESVAGELLLDVWEYRAT